MILSNGEGDGVKAFLEDHVANFVHNDRNSITTASRANFFIGNESADADSIISSLCYAYYKYAIDRKETEKSASAFIPIVCIERRGLHLRNYVTILLGKVGIELKSLVCLDDLSNSKSTNNDKTEEDTLQVSLLDHNTLNEPALALFSRQGSQEYHVKEIIDHHEDMVNELPFIVASCYTYIVFALNMIYIIATYCQGNHMECKQLDRMIAFDKGKPLRWK